LAKNKNILSLNELRKPAFLNYTIAFLAFLYITTSVFTFFPESHICKDDKTDNKTLSVNKSENVTSHARKECFSCSLSESLRNLINDIQKIVVDKPKELKEHFKNTSAKIIYIIFDKYSPRAPPTN